MIRDFEIHEGKLAPAYASAVASVKTGMGVVLNRASKTFAAPSSATAENLHVVHKARKATGANTNITDFSDYFVEFNEVAAGEFAPLYAYEFGEAFGTDQFDSTTVSSATAAGTFLGVGSDGKWTALASGSKSAYRFVKLYTDAGNHTLAYIEVIDQPGENA